MGAKLAKSSFRKTSSSVFFFLLDYWHININKNAFIKFLRYSSFWNSSSLVIYLFIYFGLLTNKHKKKIKIIFLRYSSFRNSSSSVIFFLDYWQINIKKILIIFLRYSSFRNLSSSVIFLFFWDYWQININFFFNYISKVLEFQKL